MSHIIMGLKKLNSLELIFVGKMTALHYGKWNTLFSELFLNSTGI